MRMRVMTASFGVLVLLCFSCKDKSTSPETQQSISFSARSGKCLSQGLAKTSGLDSLFTYSFGDTLIIDFSVSANCCPDSNRFNISENIASDTLVVSVVDTAQQLCRCVCPYMIEAQFANLSNDHYVVRCRTSTGQGSVDPIYLVDVYRTH